MLSFYLLVLVKIFVLLFIQFLVLMNHINYLMRFIKFYYLYLVSKIVNNYTIYFDNIINYWYL